MSLTRGINQSVPLIANKQEDTSRSGVVRLGSVAPERHFYRHLCWHLIRPITQMGDGSAVNLH